MGHWIKAVFMQLERMEKQVVGPLRRKMSQQQQGGEGKKRLTAVFIIVDGCLCLT